MKIKTTIIFLLLSVWIMAENFSDEDDLARWSVRRGMKRSLYSLPENAQEKISNLLQDIKNEKISTRIDALKSLAKVGRGNQKIALAIVNLLKNEQFTEVSIWAALAFGDIGLKQPNVLSALRKLANDKNIRVRRAVSMALAEISADNLVISFATDKNPTLREIAARSFVNMGKSAKKHLAVIESLSKDKNIGVRREARWALNIIANSDNFYQKEKDLILAAQKNDQKIRKKAFASLVKFGSDSIPFFIELTKSHDKNVSLEAKEALENIQKQQQLAIFAEKRKIQEYIQSDSSYLIGELIGNFEIPVGQKSSYSFTIRNTGNKTAYGIRTLMMLPSNFEYNNRAGSTAISWSLSSLEPSKDHTYKFEGMALSAGKDKFLVRITQKELPQINLRYPYIVTKGELKPKSNLPLNISMDFPKELKVNEKNMYIVNLESVNGTSLENITLRIVLPFNTKYGDDKYPSVFKYRINELREKITRQFELTHLCSGSGSFDVVATDDEGRQKTASFALKIDKKGLPYHRVTAKQNNYQVDMQSAMSAVVVEEGNGFICRTSIHNESDKVKSVTTKIYTSSNINCPERGGERRTFEWTNTIRPGLKSNYFIPLNGLSVGKGKVTVKGLVDGEEIFVADHQITVE
ncbi:HEAT repeat domain-containing protein [Candidatus Uabimicrobium sp. HlEnr_7]|uniref:HEAT repeat domain-containing protein n=1 Tax=Candidatus Uabimicrobium helgolandensis TaxID=3095367 RepID=UPI003555EF10